MKTPSYQSFLKHELRLHMEQNQLSPPYQLQIDNEKHAYPTDKGMAWYVAGFETSGSEDYQLTGRCGYEGKNRKRSFSLSLKELMNQ